MITTTTAVQPSKTLRRRTNVLDGKTHTTHPINLGIASSSVTSSDSTKDHSNASDSEGDLINNGGQKNLTLSDEESDDDEGETDDISDSAEGVPEDQNIRKRPPTLPSINTANILANDDSQSSPMSPNSRAWYEFDLAVVVALVSPIGNWLTGGDYIKNIFLVILLIFYLHHIIEVPWELYQKARPRRRAPNMPAQTVEDKYRHVATSELRSLELFFLAMTAISPFLGATFLRYATASVIGQESVSWFSTALFVLATGMRPWSHVIERFRQRTNDLHDVIHYPSPNPATQDLNAQMAELLKRVEQLDKALSKTKTRIVDTTEEVYEYVDEMVTAVDRTVKKQEKKCEKNETKIKEIEQVVEHFKGKGTKKGVPTIHTAIASESSLLASILPSWLFLKPPIQRSPHTLSRSPTTSKHALRTFPSTPTVQLETIPEEETGRNPVINQLARLPSLAISRIGYFATMPLRAVVRMILQRY